MREKENENRDNRNVSEEKLNKLCLVLLAVAAWSHFELSKKKVRKQPVNWKEKEKELSWELSREGSAA